MGLFDGFRKSVREMFASTEKMLDDVEADFKKLDFADVEPNTETKTVEETRHANGSITIKTTTVRKLVVKK